MRIPRILLTAAASGCGKTLITCGILNLLKRRGMHVVSFKCGPDYIDPMFHTKVIGTKSRNLDTFFTDKDTTCYLLEKHAAGCDIAVIEGVMGYYDGIGGVSTRASAWETAQMTGTPAILLVDAKGTSVSAAALIRGFAEFKKDGRIAGVILNRLSPMMYPRMKEVIEKEVKVPVLGYVPVLKECLLDSRHLGLVLPDEVAELQGKLDQLSRILEESLEMDKILELAENAGEWKDLPKKDGLVKSVMKGKFGAVSGQKLRIGLAEDEAFCFMYQDNLELLEELGAKLVPFSPIHDKKLPDGLDGLLLYGGYPELYAEKLSENGSMRESIREAVLSGLPTAAECGGFMYLHNTMEDMEGHVFAMAGVLEGAAFRTDHLNRFGYVTLDGGEVFGQKIGPIPAHEFHYFDSTCCGEAFTARKPLSTRKWSCIHSSKTLFAGFPHLYYYGNPKFAEAFLLRCQERWTQ